MKSANLLALCNFEPDRATFLDEVLQGLAQRPKTLPCKYFYDAWGSRLFEEICQLTEYYPTRTELSIMYQAIGEIVDAIGPDCLLIEYGSGNSYKTCLLLDHAPHLAGYIPIDISRNQLVRTVGALANLYPRLRVCPVCADYTQPYELPSLPPGNGQKKNLRRVVFFPGSTIGNFSPLQAVTFLRHIAEVCGPAGGLLIGVDLKKDPRLLVPAYNDPRGVTAAFNLNLLHRINRELGADFQLDRFSHYAFYNPRAGRIEMHLVSLDDQEAHLGGATLPFTVGESIWTESSYKYSLDEFARLAAEAGFRVDRVWCDSARLFSVQYLAVAG